eukprot:5963472-Amphidinium_carterae.1
MASKRRIAGTVASTPDAKRIKGEQSPSDGKVSTETVLTKRYTLRKALQSPEKKSMHTNTVQDTTK